MMVVALDWAGEPPAGCSFGGKVAVAGVADRAAQAAVGAREPAVSGMMRIGGVFREIGIASLAGTPSPPRGRTSGNSDDPAPIGSGLGSCPARACERVERGVAHRARTAASLARTFSWWDAIPARIDSRAAHRWAFGCSLRRPPGPRSSYPVSPVRIVAAADACSEAASRNARIASRCSLGIAAATLRTPAW